MSDDSDSNGSDDESSRTGGIELPNLDTTVTPRFDVGETVRIILHPEDSDYERLCGESAEVVSVEADDAGSEENPELGLIYRLQFDEDDDVSGLLFREPDLRPHDEPDYTEIYSDDVIADKVEEYLETNGYPNPY
jgi:hypothetical protein